MDRNDSVESVLRERKKLMTPTEPENRRRQLIVGNWKMHGLIADLREITTLSEAVDRSDDAIDILVCVPATLVVLASRTTKKRVEIGGQDCHPSTAEAHTGDISAKMLKDAGATTVIVGHSERRIDHGEDNQLVAAKAAAAKRAGLKVVVCVGETHEQRQAGSALAICARQILESVPLGMNGSDTAIGYEPLWAIGSGHTPDGAQIVEMHGHIRQCLIERLGSAGHDVRILYGGSVNSENAAAVLALRDVGGVLVGSASRGSEEFAAIVASAPLFRGGR